MEAFKKAFLQGLLAYAGVRAGQRFAPASTTGQLVGGIGGAILGVFISAKV